MQVAYRAAIVTALLGSSAAAQAELTPPKLQSSREVAYPESETDDARVVVLVVVNADGTVHSAEAEAENDPFSSLAVQAALAWTFEPATADGRAVAAKVRIEVVFRAPVVGEPPPEEGPPPSSKQSPPEPLGPRARRPPRPAAAPGAALEVLVVGERAEPSRTVSFSRAEVRQLPGAFGDPFRAIEAMPGVTTIASGLPFFFIRGAPPGNVGYFLDGVRVPLLFHVGIGPSVIHPALVDRVDLYPGAYPARFGRFAGGIVAGETTPPSTELHGEYNLRLFDAGALAEAPVAEGRGTVLVGGRYSYSALLLSLLSPGITLEYWDYQIRASYDLAHEDTISVFAFGSHDFLGEKTQGETLTLFGTDFHRVDLRYDRALGERGRYRSAVTIGIDQSTVQNQDRSVQDRLLGTRTELEYRVAKDALLRAGADLQLDSYSIDSQAGDLSPAAQRIARFFPSRTDIALGSRADVVIDVDDRFIVTPGMRVDLYGSNGQSAIGVDPRIATRVETNDRVALLGTFGVAHQAPAFVVPVPGIQPVGLDSGLQRALQQSAGIEIDLGDATRFTATAFQNAFFQTTDPLGVAERIPQGCPPGAFPDDSLAGDFGRDPDNPIRCGVPLFPPGTLGPDRSGGTGQGADSLAGTRAAAAFEVRTLGAAHGLELLLERDLTKTVGGFVAYTLARSTRSFGRRTFVAAFDRTHVANAVIAFDLGRRWRAGARATYYTGVPKAPDPTDPGTRLPAFFRLDLRGEKRWQLGRATWIAAVAEWMNATLSTEAVTSTCTLQGCEAQTIGPVTIPSLGVEGGF